MHFVAGGLMVGAGMVGIVLLLRGVWRMLQTVRRRPYLLRVDGRIEKIERRQERSTSGRFTKTHWVYHPVIGFRHQKGKNISFTASGSATRREAQYKIGQRMPVIYDPANTFPPLVDRGLSIWSPPLQMLFVGLALIGVALAIRSMFGAQIFQYFGV
jgi:hypothetical protein